MLITITSVSFCTDDWAGTLANHVMCQVCKWNAWCACPRWNVCSGEQSLLSWCILTGSWLKGGPLILTLTDQIHTGQKDWQLSYPTDSPHSSRTGGWSWTSRCDMLRDRCVTAASDWKPGTVRLCGWPETEPGSHWRTKRLLECLRETQVRHEDVLSRNCCVVM